MAECHPVAFRWVMQAKLKGAKVIHADPRFTPHHRGGGHARPDPGRQRYRLPRRPHQLRHQFRALELRALLPRVRHHLHQCRHHHQ